MINKNAVILSLLFLVPALVNAQSVVLTGYGKLHENIQHPEGHVFDQVVLTGAYVVVRPKPNTRVRVSYIDENDDIVNVEMWGEGKLRVAIDPDTYSGPAPPVKYNQNVRYVKGRASLILDGAQVDTYLQVYTVGPINTINQALFIVNKKRQSYNGIADIASLHVYGTDMASLLLSNARFSDDEGPTGILAYNVNVRKVVIVHDIDAKGLATPHLVIGRNSPLIDNNGAVVVAGGDLVQQNGEPIRIEVGSGITSRTIVSLEGITSSGKSLSAKTIKASFKQDYDKPFVDPIYMPVNNSDVSLDGKTYEYTFDNDPGLRMIIEFNGHTSGDFIISELFSLYRFEVRYTRTGVFGFGLHPVQRKKGFIDINGGFMNFSAGFVSIAGSIDEVADKYGFALPKEASIKITLPPESSSFGTFEATTVLTDGDTERGSGTFRRVY